MPAVLIEKLPPGLHATEQEKKTKPWNLKENPLPLAVLSPDNAMTVSAGRGEMFLGSSTSTTKTEQRWVIWGREAINR